MDLFDRVRGLLNATRQEYRNSIERRAQEQNEAQVLPVALNRIEGESQIYDTPFGERVMTPLNQTPRVGQIVAGTQSGQIGVAHTPPLPQIEPLPPDDFIPFPVEFAGIFGTILLNDTATEGLLQYLVDSNLVLQSSTPYLFDALPIDRTGSMTAYLQDEYEEPTQLTAGSFPGLDSAFSGGISLFFGEEDSGIDNVPFGTDSSILGAPGSIYRNSAFRQNFAFRVQRRELEAPTATAVYNVVPNRFLISATESFRSFPSATNQASASLANVETFERTYIAQHIAARGGLITTYTFQPFVVQPQATNPFYNVAAPGFSINYRPQIFLSVYKIGDRLNTEHVVELFRVNGPDVVVLSTQILSGSFTPYQTGQVAVIGDFFYSGDEFQFTITPDETMAITLRYSANYHTSLISYYAYLQVKRVSFGGNVLNFDILEPGNPL